MLLPIPKFLAIQNMDFVLIHVSKTLEAGLKKWVLAGQVVLVIEY